MIRCTATATMLVQLIISFAYGELSSNNEAILNQRRSELRLTSNIARDFVSAIHENRETPIPDFSYVGYHNGEKGVPEEGNYLVNTRFLVTDYGAYPNDGHDDQLGVQKAIDAASENGGGIVFFPPGIFHFRTDPLAPREIITITSSGIVLKGSGIGINGTTLHIVHDDWDGPVEGQLTANDGSPYFGMKQRSGKNFIHFQGNAKPRGSQGTLTKTAYRPTRQIILDSNHTIEAGDFISINYNTQAASAKDYVIYGLPTNERWGINNGVKLHEYHEVEKVEGNVVTLKSGLYSSLKPEWDVQVNKTRMISECGIEDLTLLGGWVGNFSHHRSMVDNESWTFVTASGVRDFWMRRIHAINGNAVLSASHSARISAYQIRQLGSVSHNGIKPRRSTSTFVGHFFDHSDGNCHPMGCGFQNVGLVIWRCEMNPTTGIDFHGGYSIATLVDRVQGGGCLGSGGTVEDFPNHGRDLVFWNFFFSPDYWKNESVMNIWGERPSFAAPFFVGLHGKQILVPADMAMVNQTQGNLAIPESLYEGQLKFRLNGEPEWILKLKAQRQAFLGVDSIPFYHSNRDHQNAYRFVTKFPIRNFAWHVVGISGLRDGYLLRLEDSTNEDMEYMQTDFSMARQLLWCLGNYAESFVFNSKNKDQLETGNHISIKRIDATNTTEAIIQLQNPSPLGFLEKTRQKDELGWKEYASAHNIAKAIGAVIQYEEGEDKIIVSIPDLELSKSKQNK